MKALEVFLVVARWLYKGKYSKGHREESNLQLFQDKTVVVLTPHPDDEIIGIGGSIIKLKSIYPNLKVYFIYMTNGDLGDDTMAPSVVSHIRKEEAIHICKDLNIEAVFLDLPERHFIDQRKESAEKLHQALLEIKPDLVIVPSILDYHTDHINTNLLLNDCRENLQSIKAFEILMYPVRIPFVKRKYTNFIIDISEQIDEKEQILVESYESQAKIINMQRFLINNKIQGVMIGKRAVEVFWHCTPKEFADFIDYFFYEPNNEKTYKWSLLPHYAEFKFSPFKPMRRYALSKESQSLLP